MEPPFDSLIAWKGGVVMAWFAVLFGAERLLPAVASPVGGLKESDGRHRLARNLGLWLLNVGLSPLFVLPVSLWAVGQQFDWRPLWWSGWQGLVIDVVVLDFLIYWWHMANHRVGLLWRFHEVHHLDPTLDTTTAVRFHFGEVALSAIARAVVIIVLQVPFTSVLLFEVLLLMAAVFHHSNLRLPSGLERGLAKVVITPSIHWVHHHAVQADTDSNYGTIFSFWDPLFGSRSATARRPDMAIGVEGRAERPLGRLLIRPFRPAAERAEEV